MAVHLRAQRVAEATRTIKKQLNDLLAAQHALVVSALGGKPLGWSAVVATVDEPDDCKELEQLHTSIEQLQDQLVVMPVGAAKVEKQAKLELLEEERLRKSGLALRRVVGSSVWEASGPVHTLADKLSAVRLAARRMHMAGLEEWQDVLSWNELSNVWVESKLFESASYASFARMKSDVMQHSDAVMMTLDEGMAVLGGSYRSIHCMQFSL